MTTRVQNRIVIASGATTIDCTPTSTPSAGSLVTVKLAEANGVCSPPDGTWFQANPDPTGTNLYTYIFWHIAVASDPTTYVFTISAGPDTIVAEVTEYGSLPAGTVRVYTPPTPVDTPDSSHTSLAINLGTVDANVILIEAVLGVGGSDSTGVTWSNGLTTSANLTSNRLGTGYLLTTSAATYAALTASWTWTHSATLAAVAFEVVPAGGPYIVQQKIASATTTSSLTITLDSPPAAGNLLEAQCTGGNATSWNVPSGWTLAQASSGLKMVLAGFLRPVLAGDGQAWSFAETPTVSDSIRVVLTEWGGVPSGPVSVDSAGTVDGTAVSTLTDHPTPTTTTSAVEIQRSMLGVGGSGSTVASFSAPSGLTKQNDLDATVGAASGYRVTSSVGSVDPVTASWATANSASLVWYTIKSGVPTNTAVWGFRGNFTTAPPPPPPPSANGPASRARAIHVDINAFGDNSQANAFTNETTRTGITFPWGMSETGPEIFIAQGNVQDLMNGANGNFNDGRFKPKWLVTLYGSYSQDNWTAQDIANGVADAQYIKMCQFVNATFPAVAWRWGWEVDGGWFPWAADPVAYVNGFRHFVNVVRANCTIPCFIEFNAFANLQIKYTGNMNAPMSFSNGSPYGAGNTYANYYPGDAYVDIIGCDSYVLPNDNPATLFVFPMRCAAQFALAHGKQVGFSEWGFDDTAAPSGQSAMDISGATVTAMDAVLAFFDSLPSSGAGSLIYHMYFEGNPGGGSFTLQPHYPNAYAVYRTRMLQP